MANKLVSAKSIKSVSLIHSNGEVQKLYKRKGGKGGQSLPLKPFEKAQKVGMEAARDGADAYLKAHKRSNEQKKDGWANDLADNTWKANVQVFKKIRKSTPK